MQFSPLSRHLILFSNTHSLCYSLFVIADFKIGMVSLMPEMSLFLTLYGLVYYVAHCYIFVVKSLFYVSLYFRVYMY
jgi:hypothetical protein